MERETSDLTTNPVFVPCHFNAFSPLHLSWDKCFLGIKPKVAKYNILLLVCISTHPLVIHIHTVATIGVGICSMFCLISSNATHITNETLEMNPEVWVPACKVHVCAYTSAAERAGLFGLSILSNTAVGLLTTVTRIWCVITFIR